MVFVDNYPSKETLVKKHLLLVITALLLVSMAGCIDLLAVPGIALSPDGTRIYFLGGDFNAMSGDSDSDSTLSLTAVNLGDGSSQVIASSTDTSFVGAFDVNPTNGDLAYMVASDSSEVSIMIQGADGSSRSLTAPGAFGGLALGTMMEYSPDGSQIAVTGLLFPPEMTPDMLENSEELTPEQIALIKNVAWIINAGDGSVRLISNPDAERANTIAWNPASNRVAYNAWVDTNGDGKISTGGGFGIPGMTPAGATGSDFSEIRLYDVGGGSTTTIASTGLSFAPTFFNDNTLAYISLDASTAMAGGEVTIFTADIGSGQSTPFHSSSSLITGIRVSPDGTQVAWAELDSGGAASSSSGEMPPSHIFVSPVGSAAPNQVAELPGAFLVDTPVWTPDNKGLLISSTNIFSSLIGGMMSGFSSLDPSATPVAGLPQGQQVTRIDLESGKTIAVYEGGMLNSGLFASFIGLAELEEMGGMMGSQ
jgi:hypothetical protein